MIALSPLEIRFIKENKEILADLFKRRIEDLQNELLFVPEQERSNRIAVIIEFKSWAETIKVFSKPRIKKVKDNGV